MESLSIAEKRNKFRHRLTPNKEVYFKDTNKNFSFADWKPALLRKSPTNVLLPNRPKIEDFYKQEQKKTIKIHRSFDHRKKNSLAEVHQMNDFIKKILNQHSNYKKNFFSVNRSVKDLQAGFDDKGEENKKTPHFIKINNKFPRDVFTISSKKSKAGSNL